MTEQQRFDLDLNRLKRLSDSPKNIKCPGVTRKLRRKIRKSPLNVEQ